MIWEYPRQVRGIIVHLTDGTSFDQAIDDRVAFATLLHGVVVRRRLIMHVGGESPKCEIRCW